MATWRRKLISLFPDIHIDACASDFTPYSAFFELLPRCRSAHERGDISELTSIYGYAEWCLNQKAKDLWNPAGVCFYEHLFDMPKSLWPNIVQWLSPNVVGACKGLWKCRLNTGDFLRIDELLQSCKIKRYIQLQDHLRST